MGDGLKRVNKPAQREQFSFAPCDSGDEYMPYPHLFSHCGQPARHLKDVFIREAGERFVQRVIHGLDVQQDEVGMRHQRVKALLKLRRFPIRRAGGIQRRVRAVRFGEGEKRICKIHLQHWLPAGKRHAAARMPVALVPACFFPEGAGARPSAACMPGVGIMAVLAAHGASGKERGEAHARPIHKGEGFDGMDAPDDVTAVRGWIFG